MGLQKLRREPKAGLAGAGRANAAEIEVAGVGGIFRAGVHGEPFRGGQQHSFLVSTIFISSIKCGFPHCFLSF